MNGVKNSGNGKKLLMFSERSDYHLFTGGGRSERHMVMVKSSVYILVKIISPFC